MLLRDWELLLGKYWSLTDRWKRAHWAPLLQKKYAVVMKKQVEREDSSSTQTVAESGKSWHYRC